MSQYTETYESVTGKKTPVGAEKLDYIFNKIAKDEPLPPKGQQAVDIGFTAHTLNNNKENSPIYNYYQWILKNVFHDKKVNELTSQLVGTSFVSANIFETNLPQPVTLNPWQIDRMTGIKLMNQQAIIIENNGVFVWLYHRHPQWPLINQSGNDFNESYNRLLKQLSDQGLEMTYLGDLDSEGIGIADRVFSLLNQDLFAIQTPARVADWLIRFGKDSNSRTKRMKVTNQMLVRELESIHLFKKFVEQEQLIDEYETLIEKWLEKNTLG